MAKWWMILPSCGLFAVIALATLIDGARSPAAVEAGSAALPFVSPMFGDNMVLQRGKPNTIWGWSKPGESITVELAGQTATATAGPDGRWQTQIQPPAPGG